MKADRDPLPPVATRAGDTHPTGMHSCWMNLWSVVYAHLLVSDGSKIPLLN